ncbi:L-ascorbate metabolism protein UlaG (beta-lactamase superfamily) [Mangrovibacterium marinum]|uniref:L-ascorbate metabolism protein UlaG (Beta-lactamase superfamily) n=2 Tax=Mangrovibacterium marinum TaxID=1639118 RepID=A0A2T5C3C9_9BACT|nr:L-ascorbate metabolism protein UlaG (beta-lactamase superfamily) [Mangrovibacterium marinum]
MMRLIQILFVIVILITVTGMSILNQTKFGQSPKGERLERIKKSPNYVDGEFRNVHETPMLTTEDSGIKMMMDFLFRNKARLSPVDSIPVVKTDLKSLNPQEDVLIWFGHSSYFIRLAGKTFLIDPVLSAYASPFSFVNKAFKGTSSYTADDFPSIDYLIITHDHWDHLDYKTVMDLKQKTGQVVCALGVGQHFEYWGFDPSIITELDWYEAAKLDDGWRLTATPARHFSGRGLKRNQSLWASFVLKTPSFNIYIGGDSGYDDFFATIGTQYGPFDLAILEQGQYDQNWNLIHLLPEKLFDAATQLQARCILPVHNSKFALANHPWDEPLNKVIENHTDSGISVLTPMIGAPVLLNDSTQQFEKWWNDETRG